MSCCSLLIAMTCVLHLEFKIIEACLKKIRKLITRQLKKVFMKAEHTQEHISFAGDSDKIDLVKITLNGQSMSYFSSGRLKNHG